MTNQECDSAIGLHLLQNHKNDADYSNDKFSILAKVRSMFFLSTLKVISKRLGQYFVAKKNFF